MRSERDTVVEAIANLALTGVVTLPRAEELRLYDTLEARFSSRPGATWIWEHISVPHSSRICDGRPWMERLLRVLPESDARLLFFADSDGDDVSVFEATAKDIVAILGECSAFEYCISPRAFSWMVCETHHDVLVAAGEPVQSRLAAL